MYKSDVNLIITGMTEEAHITSADDAAIYLALMGGHKKIKPISSFKIKQQNGNFYVQDGVGFLNGRAFRILEGEEILLNLEYPTAVNKPIKNNIFAVYSKNEHGYEDVAITVLNEDEVNELDFVDNDNAALIAKIVTSLNKYNSDSQLINGVYYTVYESEVTQFVRPFNLIHNTLAAHAASIANNKVTITTFQPLPVPFAGNSGSVGGVCWSKGSNKLITLNLRIKFSSSTVAQNSGIIARIPAEYYPPHTIAGTIVWGGMRTELDSSGNVKVYGTAPESGTVINLSFNYSIKN